MSLPPPSHQSSPPTKASLMKWWKVFSSKHKAPENEGGGGGGGGGKTTPGPYVPPGRGLGRTESGEGRVFGVSPEQSLKYASVAISMVGPDSKPYIYGYVPIVVAKCGMMLKETATATEGIFRVSGSNKRINQLQAVFDSPPRYGKDLDWTPFTQHDAASVLRRYLNMMPEPVIPQDLYKLFTDVLQRQQPLHQSILDYRHLINLLPPTSRYLLLYLLDFLSVFARCSSQNLMTASNLATVFQPGLVSTRKEGGSLVGFPGFDGEGGIRVSEHGRGKEVLEFLIEQQSHFMLGLEPPKKEKREEKERSEEVGLSRRGSEKSVERRRLRKSQMQYDENGGESGKGKVKRSKTLPSGKGRGEDPKSQPSPNPPTSSPSQSPNPATGGGVFRRGSKKVKRESQPPPTTTTSRIQIPPGLNGGSEDVTMTSSGEKLQGGGWSPPWRNHGK